MKRFLEKISSPLCIFAFSLPLLLFSTVAVGWLKISPALVGNMRVALGFFAFVALALLLRTTLAARRGEYGAALVSLGLLMLLVQGGYSCWFSFSGKSSVGIDESPDRFYEVEAGRFAATPRIPLVLKAAQTGKAPACTVLLDGRERRLAAGQSVVWNDLTLTVNAIAEAPLFILSDEGGTEHEAGYIKIRHGVSEEDFFQFTAIPHRFYVYQSGREHEQWKSAGKQWQRSIVPAQASGGKLHLLIMRGKLTLFDADVKKGERVAFERQQVRLEQGVPCIEITVQKARHSYFLYAGALLCAAGGILLLLRRGRA